VKKTKQKSWQSLNEMRQNLPVGVYPIEPVWVAAVVVVVAAAVVAYRNRACRPAGKP
jgi:hypothetical protein